MNVTLRVPTNIDEFLAWEERQEPRYEFDGVQAIAMVGGTSAHERIALNIACALRAGLRPGCHPYVNGMKLRLAGTVRYPDVMVVCSRVRNDATYVTDPVVVFEVLSESTSRTDRLVKSQEYGATSSIARYVIIEQTGIGATVFERPDFEHPDWRGRPLTGADTLLAMPEIGVGLRLGDCYAGIEFEPEPG